MRVASSRSTRQPSDTDTRDRPTRAIGRWIRASAPVSPVTTWISRRRQPPAIAQITRASVGRMPLPYHAARPGPGPVVRSPAMVGLVFFALSALASLPPVPAAHAAAWAVGRPDIAPALVSICRRESRCARIGIHPRDVGRDPSDGWVGQVRLGHLRPWCQPRRARTWSTRGAWGMSAASAWPYMPACYQAAWLDVPVIAAVAAARRYIDRCDGGKRRGWCHVRRRT